MKTRSQKSSSQLRGARSIEQVVAMLIVFMGASCGPGEDSRCQIAGGEEVTTIQQFSVASIEEVHLHGHLSIDVEGTSGDSIQLEWTGREHWLDHESWARLESGVLELGYEPTCQWTRDLSDRVRLLVRLPYPIPLKLFGQGDFAWQMEDSSRHIRLDAYAFAGEVQLHVEADSCRVALHAGAAIAEVQGGAQVVELFASGLSRLNGSGLTAREAYVNQSGIQPLQFRSSDYAYVMIATAGDVLGGLIPPDQVELERIGSGELRWE